MSEPSFLSRLALVGALALATTGLSAAVEGAQAMPVAPVQAGAGDAGVPTAVQYVYPRRHRRAGVYGCGRNELHTHLERRACGFSRVGHNGRYR